MKIDVTGLRKTIESFRKMSSRAANLAPVLQVALQDLKTMEVDTFRAGVDPATGNKWQALSESTLEKRRKGRRRFTPKTLVDTGVLRNSLVTKTANSIQGVQRDLIIFGTTVPYAGVHQFGSKRISKRSLVSAVRAIPKRPFIPTRFDVAGTLAFMALEKIKRRIKNYIVTGKKTPAKE